MLKTWGKKRGKLLKTWGKSGGNRLKRGGKSGGKCLNKGETAGGSVKAAKGHQNQAKAKERSENGSEPLGADEKSESRPPHPFVTHPVCRTTIYCPEAQNL